MPHEISLNYMRQLQYCKQAGKAEASFLALCAQEMDNGRWFIGFKSKLVKGVDIIISAFRDCWCILSSPIT